jgi:catechol 2,3-dioxygenase-like lactoylglutathione lyase family enzyme
VVKILGLHHSGIPCNDLDRATDFYTRVLGMEVVGIVKAPNARGHFVDMRIPPEVDFNTAELEKDYEEWVAAYQQRQPGKVPPTRFSRLRAGNVEVVLFERPDPLESDTLMENGIFHQSFHISADDLDRLLEMKQQGNSDIRFHTGPVLRWPHGRAIYIWDSEGNYLELESEEHDLPSKLLPSPS